MKNWIETARKLQLGQKRKVKHCGKDPSAYISNGPNGVSLHCFRCKTNEFEPHGRLSASDILAMRRSDAEAAKQPYPEVVPLYDDTCVPSAARVWVLKAGISPERATDNYGFGWCSRTSRVVIPILRDGEPTGKWIGRSLERNPKYLMPNGAAGTVWLDTRGAGPLVVVEDVLSAIRVAGAGYKCAAVLGTSVSTAQLAAVGAGRVCGWFDNDAGGRQGWVNLRKACAPLGIEPTRVKSDADPKTYDKETIQKYIRSANGP